MLNDKIFVVAGNHAQFREFMKRKAGELWDQGHEVSYSNFVYVSGPEVFRGFSSVHGYFVGTFRERKDLAEIVQHIKIVNLLPYDCELFP